MSGRPSKSEVQTDCESSVITLHPETYRLKAHFFFWKNRFHQTPVGYQNHQQPVGHIFWEWESYPEIEARHVICFIMRRKKGIPLTVFWSRPPLNKKNVIFLAISWFWSIRWSSDRQSSSDQHRYIFRPTAWCKPVRPPIYKKLY